jgi:preflagellin peptidase FlaK
LGRLTRTTYVVDVGPLSAPLTDVVRLATLPVFAAIAWRDIETRRVPSIYWAPLTTLGVGLLYLDWQQAAALGSLNYQTFLVSTALGLGFLVPLAFLFHYIGAFGGADARALMTIAVLFPVYPEVVVGQTLFPLERAPLPVFSFTVLSNAIVCGVAYPFVLAVRNGARGTVSGRMFSGLSVPVADLPTTYGKLMSSRESGGLLDWILTLFVPRRRGLDLDALRMYLRWRGLTLAELRRAPAHYRDPETLPEDPNPPTDGAVTAEAVVDVGGDALSGEDAPPASDLDDAAEADYDDPWGAEAFLEANDAYGTMPETLEHGLDHVTEAEEVWVTPGIPFLVPIVAGIILAFAYGDLLISGLGALGLF